MTSECTCRKKSASLFFKYTMKYPWAEARKYLWLLQSDSYGRFVIPFISKVEFFPAERYEKLWGLFGSIWDILVICSFNLLKDCLFWCIPLVYVRHVKRHVQPDVRGFLNTWNLTSEKVQVLNCWCLQLNVKWLNLFSQQISKWWNWKDMVSLSSEGCPKMLSGWNAEMKTGPVLLCSSIRLSIYVIYFSWPCSCTWKNCRILLDDLKLKGDCKLSDAFQVLMLTRDLDSFPFFAFAVLEKEWLSQWFCVGTRFFLSLYYLYN